MSGPIGILVMAYGTASGPEDVERYYTDIRGGRPPPPEHVAELRGRYAAIGNRFPLLETTRSQAEALERGLRAAGIEARAYLGMKHSPPFIPEGVARMSEDGIERGVGLVMAPHWSAMSVEGYVARVREAVDDGGPTFTFIRHWYDHPAFVAFLASRVVAALEALDADHRPAATVVFSAHSLPTRTLPDGTSRCKTCELCPDGCTYVRQLHHTAELVAGKLGLDDVEVAWQSAGRTADPWWGAPVEEVIRDVAARGSRAVVVCSAGFVADHLETLYDLDVEARAAAEQAGVAFSRTEMPNVDPAFIGALAEVVRDHLRLEGWDG